MHYRVIFTGDRALPIGKDWALVTMTDGAAYCLIRKSRISAALLSEAWAAWEQVARARVPA